MAISKCISLSADNRVETEFLDYNFHINETGYHGTEEFPVAIYYDDITNEYVHWHWHEEFEIGFVTEGSIVLCCGIRSYILECGDIFFVNSNVLHAMHHQNKTGQAAFKSIAFHNAIISENEKSIFYRKYIQPILSNENFTECVITKENYFYQEMLDLLISVWQLIDTEPLDYEIKVRNELSIVCCRLNQLLENKKETITHKNNYTTEKRVKLLLDYMHANYQEQISIEALAKCAAISKTEVLRCFRTILGQSPIHYINEYRLQKAAHLLIHTRNNIQEIAEKCGFDDNSYFTKLFKRKYHVTPSEYRKEIT